MTTRLKPRSTRADAGPSTVEEDFDLIRCRDCGASHPTVEGPAMLYALKSPCPHCGGDCELAVVDGSLQQVA
jgi:hypothetical protein